MMHPSNRCEAPEHAERLRGGWTARFLGACGLGRLLRVAAMAVLCFVCTAALVEGQQPAPAAASKPSPAKPAGPPAKTSPAKASAAKPPAPPPLPANPPDVPLESLRGPIERLVAPVLASQRAMGITIGLLHGPKTAAFGFGRVSRQSSVVPNDRTVYEIGSVTKTFTGILLADAVVRKRMALDDPIRKWLPKDAAVPARGGKEILLWHLSTHSSGLPRLSRRLIEQVVKSLDNPYSRYTPEEAYADLRGLSLDCIPGEKYAYSNYGAGLLGLLLARDAGETYESLVRRRICQPLGMHDTTMTLSPDQRSRLAPGHDADLTPTGNWDIPTLAGAGALRSTVHDMLRYAAGNIEGNSPLKDAAALAHTPRFKAVGPHEIGLGWHCNTKQQFLWHNGQTGGYHSYVALSKPKRLAVVVLGNCADGTVDRLGDQILLLLCGGKPEPLPLKPPKRVDVQTLKRYEGSYETLGMTFTVTREEDRLFVQLTGQPRFRVYPDTETEFAYRVVEARITFVPNKDGQVDRLVLHQNGLNIPAVKNGLIFYAGRKALDILRTPAKPQAKPDAKPAAKPEAKPPAPSSK